MCECRCHLSEVGLDDVTSSLKTKLVVWFISQLCFCLVGNSFLPSLELSLIEQVVVLEGSHVLVELEDKRARGGNIVCQNLLLAHAGKVHDNGTEGVSVSNDDWALAFHHLGADGVVPVWEHTVDSDLK